MIKIQQYSTLDEEEWLKCHTQSYYQSGFFDTLLKVKPRYETPSIELVGLNETKIVGILDIELEEEAGQLCNNNKQKTGLISVIGVLPNFRRKKIATNLITNAIETISKKHSIHRLELWTREDTGIISWLKWHQFIEIYRYYQVTLTSDFFSKFDLNLPFGLSPESLIANVDESTYATLLMYHPPEKAERILIFEKYI
ncbi:MAG: GNAT family N-acetyltransferase [Candidatus Hodarchaeales archaeon]|jgi:ribosomal protein S18 acetylase RimI-like enzyme